jgi:S1-C subfamily serine protease
VLSRRVLSRRLRSDGCNRRAAPHCGLFALAVLLSAAVATPTAAGHGQNRAGQAGSDRVKSGTGFFVSRDGFLVTSEHVVSGCPKLSIWQPDGTERASYIIASDRRLDLALLWTDGLATHPAAVAAAAMPKSGEAVFTMGFATIATQPLSPVVVEGSVVGPGIAKSDNRILLIKARLHPGNSGGALLARDGSLLGMIVGRDEEHSEFGVAIPRDDIEALLGAYGIRLPAPTATTDPLTALTTISVLIQCDRTKNP